MAVRDRSWWQRSPFDLAVAVPGRAALWGWARTWRSRLSAPSLKYLSVPLRPQTLPRTRKRENYMLRFADLAEINPPRKARLEMPGPIAPGRACPGSAVSDSGAAPLRGGAGKLPPAPLGWQRARPSPSNPQGGSRRRQNRLGLNVGEKAEQLCKKGGHSCRERVWPQLLGGAARLGSILKGQKGWRRQPVPRRTPAGRAGVGTGRSRTMLSGIWAEGLLALHAVS